MVMHCVRLLATLGKFKVHQQHDTKRNALFLRCKPALRVLATVILGCSLKIDTAVDLTACQSRQTEEFNLQCAILTANVTVVQKQTEHYRRQLCAK
jgi:hypothetical protein